MRADHAAVGVLALLLLAPIADAQDASSAPPTRPGNRRPAPPDLEFLEYLGSLVREGDTWVDPADLRGPAEEENDRITDEERQRSTQPAPSSAKEQ